MKEVEKLTAELQASGRRQRGHWRVRRIKRENSPELASAPETRNGCEPLVLKKKKKKKRRDREGEAEGSQEAYLKDLSCMVM